MEIKKQKDIFLQSEGDNWFKRNKETLKKTNLDTDYLFKEILCSSPITGHSLNVLEIGCGNGKRLLGLQQQGYKVIGIDPSKSAIDEAKANGIEAYVGTADTLSFSDEQFDILVFGFCLYLCDRDDLFKIAAEANRVLKKNGSLYILDFYAKNEIINDYHHLEGIKSYKMDYSKLFDWHPGYTLIKQSIGAHPDFKPTDDKNEWISISVLRKL